MAQSLEMMDFVKRNPCAFKHNQFWYPGLFAVFKMFGSIFAMVANIFIILHQDNIEESIMDFVSVLVII